MGARFVNTLNYKDGIGYFQYAQENAYFTNQTKGLIRASRKDAEKIAKANLAGSALVGQSIYNNTQALQQIESQNGRMHSAILDANEISKNGFSVLDNSMKDGFYNVTAGISNMNETLILGFSELQKGMVNIGAKLDMSFASIVQQFELQRSELKEALNEIKDILRNRKKTDAHERFRDGKAEFESYLKFPVEFNLLEDSLKYLQESIRIYNGNPFAHLYLGHIFERPTKLYDLKKAKEHYRLCASHSKKNNYNQLTAQGFFLSGWICFADHKLDEAIELTEEAWNYDKENIPEIAYNLAKFYAIKKQPSESIYYLDIAIQKFDPEYAAKASLDRDFEDISMELNKYFTKIRNQEAENFTNEFYRFIKP